MNKQAQIVFGVSALALASAWAAPAFAQDDEAASAAAQATDCSTLATQAERDACTKSSDTTLATPTPTPSASEIVVTGSRVAGHTLANTVSPVQVLTSKDLDTRGFSTLGQALNELPSFGVPGSSPVGDGQSSFGPGQSFVNFLGLGSQRTLTLVNGQRFVSSNTSTIFGPTGSGGSQVDLNVIPTKLIDRVETVAAIGAPIYGSDAIAGTINVILKKDYQGIDLDAESGISSRGDHPDYRIRGLAGFNFAGGRGNITVAGEYNESKGLFYTDRKIETSDNRFDQPNDPNSPYQNVIHYDERIPSISTYGIPLVYDFISTAPGAQSGYYLGDPNLNLGVNNASGQQLKFDPQGNLIPIDFGTIVGQSPSNIFFSGGNGFSLPTVENLLTDTKRYSANAIANYAFSDDLHFHAEGWYSVSQGTNLTDQPAYNSALFDCGGCRDGNIILSVNNPFLSSAARTAIINSINASPFTAPGQDYFYLARANYDLQNGAATGKVTIMRGVASIDDTLHLIPGHDWHVQASANIGRSITNGRVPSLNQQNFLNAIDAVRDANGNIVCAPGYTNSPIATVSETCAPLDLFGAQTSQAARDYVTTIATPRSINKEDDYIMSISGGLFSLPGGDLSFAAGFEHRRESSRFEPGAFFYGDDSTDPRGTYGRSVPIDPVAGAYHTNEVFGELDGDIISSSNNVPLINALSFQLAGREVSNSIAGKDFTWTAGGQYSPVEGLSIRGAFTRAIRAPSVTEAFNPASSSYIFADDPCDVTNITAGPDPATRAANCAAAGVPSGFQSLSDQRSFPGVTVGNSNLQNEKSDSFTIGAAIRPTILPNFTLTVDYIDIKLKNAISEFSSDQVLDACYDSPSYPDNQFCANVSRDFTGSPDKNAADYNGNYGQLTNVTTSYFNSAVFRDRALIANLDYRAPTPFLGANSYLGLNFSYQHMFELTNQASAGDKPTITDGSIGYSHDKGQATVTYENSGFLYQIQEQFYGPAKFDRNVPANYYSIDGVGSVVYFNMSASYTINRRFTLRADVDNVLDTKPPYPSPTGGGTITYFTGVLGTYIRVGAEVKF